MPDAGGFGPWLSTDKFRASLTYVGQIDYDFVCTVAWLLCAGCHFHCSFSEVC